MGLLSEDLFRQFWIERKDWSCHTRVILLRTGCSADRAHVVFVCPLFGSFSRQRRLSWHIWIRIRVLKENRMKKPYVCLLIYHVYTCIAAYRFSRIVFSQPPLFKYIFFINNNCIYRRCHRHLRKTLIFKSLLLVYSLLKLSLLTYRPTNLLLLILLYYFYYRLLYLYTAEHRCTHCLSVTLDYPSLLLRD